MKKMLVPFLVFMLTVTLATGVMAKTLSVDLLLDGDSKVGGTGYDLHQFAVGFAMPLRDFNLSFDVASGELGKYDDTFSWKAKAGYPLFQDKKVELDLTGGVFHRKVEIPYYADYTVNTLFIGVDGKLKLDRKMNVDLGLGYGILPKEELARNDGRYYKGDPDSLFLFNLKFNYLLNPKVGLSAGYFSEKHQSELLTEDNYHSGITAGAFFRF
jgi:hypothetical protein